MKIVWKASSKYKAAITRYQHFNIKKYDLVLRTCPELATTYYGHQDKIVTSHARRDHRWIYIYQRERGDEVMKFVCLLNQNDDN